MGKDSGGVRSMRHGGRCRWQDLAGAGGARGPGMSEPCGDGLDVLVVFALVRRISPPPERGAESPALKSTNTAEQQSPWFRITFYLSPTHLGGRAPAHLPAAPHPKIQTPLPPSRAAPEPPSPPTPQAPQPCAREHARHGPILTERGGRPSRSCAPSAAR